MQHWFSISWLFPFFQYFDPTTNLDTTVTVQYLKLSSPDYPRFVLCIPWEDSKLKHTYEQQLSIHATNSTNFSVLHPTFKPMILDWGYGDAEGFDTTFLLCYRLNFPSKYYSFRLIPNSTLDRKPNSHFLDIFVSFTADEDDRYLKYQQVIPLTASKAIHGCLEFYIENLQRSELSLSRKSNVLCENELPYLLPYHQGYCADICFQRELLIQNHDVGFR